jgi:hypothetical protein
MMKKFNYFAVTIAILCLGGAVCASNLVNQDPIPTIEQVITYFNQAHLQDQAY